MAWRVKEELKITAGDEYRILDTETIQNQMLEILLPLSPVTLHKQKNTFTLKVFRQMKIVFNRGRGEKRQMTDRGLVLYGYSVLHLVEAE